MIIKSKDNELMEQFKVACEEESAAINQLAQYIQTPTHDKTLAKSLFETMERKHNKKLELWNKLQSAQRPK